MDKLFIINNNFLGFFFPKEGKRVHVDLFSHLLSKRVSEGGINTSILPVEKLRHRHHKESTSVSH